MPGFEKKNLVFLVWIAFSIASFFDYRKIMMYYIILQLHNVGVNPRFAVLS
jgi:hypothetical protein